VANKRTSKGSNNRQVSGRRRRASLSGGARTPPFVNPFEVSGELPATALQLDAGVTTAQSIPLGAGTCSWFGGPNDTGVGADEGLGLIEPDDLREWWFRHLFLSGDAFNKHLGLGRNLNPNVFYCAMRWAYGSDPEGQ
jgi:hypothetical protein